MEPKPGVVIRDVVPDHFGGGKDDGVNKLSTVVIDTLVELHSVEAAECGLEDLGHPDGFLERQVEGWWKRWELAKDADDPQPTTSETGFDPLCPHRVPQPFFTTTGAWTTWPCHRPIQASV